MDESRHQLGPELMTQVNRSKAGHRVDHRLSTNEMSPFKRRRLNLDFFFA